MVHLVKVVMTSRAANEQTSRTLEIRDATDRLDATRKALSEARQDYSQDYYGFKVTSVQRDR